MLQVPRAIVGWQILQAACHTALATTEQQLHCMRLPCSRSSAHVAICVALCKLLRLLIAPAPVPTVDNDQLLRYGQTSSPLCSSSGGRSSLPTYVVKEDNAEVEKASQGREAPSASILQGGQQDVQPVCCGCMSKLTQLHKQMFMRRMQPSAGASAASHEAHLQKVHQTEGAERQGTQYVEQASICIHSPHQTNS